MCHLLFFCGALKDAGASQVTAVTPYLCYERKDRKVEFQDSTITRHVARLMESCGIDRVAPDMGGIKRAEQFRQALAQLLARPVAMAMVEKHRQHTQLSGECLVGNVAGSTVVLFDDIISTGQTLLRAAQACHGAGASRILAAAAHGLFTTAGALFESGMFERILVADSITPFRLPAACRAQLDIFDTSALVAQRLMP
ncbi:Ribose-phosphate pyrophosphokinase [Pseudomonas hunanensis]|nr:MULTISPECIES: ribose-phosphate pyrophosphokinase-like domain-containing protein [Pseudomonas]MDX3741049.1 ribose-phosphate pyrophosphokinase-like domain-containing protein [Pseudomonas sp.]MDY7072888.1 Ribose-phosphate pyrophosphokinase [Pseudomonas hunanensis]MDD2017627.1 ribose-phosphate pyrophosphokinase-like domain-containing protein [Pseudomonas putida]MDD2073604.1 ribose-phosphate pyrophosphokinase-like domain-containing protein [Pseudomonas putida]MDF3174100.1 ribose-phosphate pyroph